MILTNDRLMTPHKESVIEVVGCSVTNLPLGGIRPRSWKTLPNILVGGQKLYTYQTLDDGVGQGYRASPHRPRPDISQELNPFQENYISISDPEGTVRVMARTGSCSMMGVVGSL
jgi:hypothetical protein